MNRVDFMRQLESLLQNVAPTEREEAIQYYNDYFDDAGAENEQDVIEALGNPARVAENIKRDLIGNGYGEAQSRKVQASDRALVKYGEKGADTGEDMEAGDDAGAGENTGQTMGAGAGENTGRTMGAGAGESTGRTVGAGAGESIGQTMGAGAGESIGRTMGAGAGEEIGSNVGGTGSFRSWENPPHSHEREPEPHEGMPLWATALIITVLVLASPVIFGLAITLISAVFTLFVAWCSFVVAFGAVAVILLLLLVVLVAVGLVCCFTDPWAGMALMGGGLICGALGLLFLMLTVAMAGVVTPAICRGISALFRIFRKRSVNRHGRRTV